jgi:membrane-bound lytic murein transglycosylase C
VEPKPILLPYVSDKEAPTEKDVDNIVDKLIAEKKPTVTQNKKGENVVTLTVPLVKEAKAVTTSARATTIPKGAKQLRGDVQKYAKQHKLDEALVFAIIETESAYNPMAKSPIPAFGLMQIVPSSAGMDATAMLFGEGRILSPSYLYTSDKNIEIGAAYLNILYYRYLKGVKDPLSRLYCSIAAYNTGAGNVSRAFIGSTKLRKALPKINALTPEQVYDHLIEHLPYEETRRYLKKVVTRMPKYTA